MGPLIRRGIMDELKYGLLGDMLISIEEVEYYYMNRSKPENDAGQTS